MTDDTLEFKISKGTDVIFIEHFPSKIDQRYYYRIKSNDEEKLINLSFAHHYAIQRMVNEHRLQFCEFVVNFCKSRTGMKINLTLVSKGESVLVDWVVHYLVTDWKVYNPIRVSDEVEFIERFLCEAA